MATRDEIKVGDRIRSTHPNGSIREGVVATIINGWPRDKDMCLLSFVDLHETYEILERGPMAEPQEFGAVVQTDDGLAIRLDGKHPGFYSEYYPWVVIGEDFEWYSDTWDNLVNPRPVTED
jgi:hypothetical protein